MQTHNNTSTKNKKSSLTRYLSIIFISIITIALATITLFNYKKNVISEKLIETVNTTIKGEIKIEKINIGSFWNYPNLNITLKNIAIFSPENKKETSKEKVIFVSKLIAIMNVEALLNSQINIKSVQIFEGSLLLNNPKTDPITIKETFLPKKTSNSNTYLNISIPNITIKQLSIRIKNKEYKAIPIVVNKLKGNFKLLGDTISGSAEFESCFGEYNLTDKISLKNTPLRTTASYTIDNKNETVLIKTKNFELNNIPFLFSLKNNFTDSLFSLDIDFKSHKNGIDFGSTFFNSSDSTSKEFPIFLDGLGQIGAKIHWKPSPNISFLNSISASLSAEGKNIELKGVDIDDFINKYQRSQNFNLADFGAVIFAGPAGLAITKGGDYTALALHKRGTKTPINHFLAEWNLKNGKLHTKDVAISTKTQRISTAGTYNINNDSLDFNISILTKSGCAIIKQNLYGKISKPAYGDIKLFKTFLGPITNLIRKIGLSKCDIVYEGKVKHPENSDKNEPEKATTH